MQKLSKEYGISKAFKDDELFKKITELTYPEVGEFLNTYVAGPTPIPYGTFLAKVGVAKTTIKTPKNIFDDGDKLNIGITNRKSEIIIDLKTKLNDFFTNLGLQNGDIILAVNNKNYTPDIANEILYDCDNWKENDSITFKIKRDEQEKIIKGTVKLPFEEIEGYKAIDSTKAKLKEAWLRG
jgi:predicted metalloprotease with PDZ domain